MFVEYGRDRNNPVFKYSVNTKLLYPNLDGCVIFLKKLAGLKKKGCTFAKQN